MERENVGRMVGWVSRLICRLCARLWELGEATHEATLLYLLSIK